MDALDASAHRLSRGMRVRSGSSTRQGDTRKGLSLQFMTSPLGPKITFSVLDAWSFWTKMVRKASNGLIAIKRESHLLLSAYKDDNCQHCIGTVGTLKVAHPICHLLLAPFLSLHTTHTITANYDKPTHHICLSLPSLSVQRRRIPGNNCECCEPSVYNGVLLSAATGPLSRYPHCMWLFPQHLERYSQSTIALVGHQTIQHLV